MLLAAMPGVAGASSWSVKGSKSQLSKAAVKLKADGAKVEHRRRSLIVEGASQGQVSRLAVRSVSKAVKVKATRDPLIKAAKWSTWNNYMGIEEAWGIGKGFGAVVAVVDTGVDLTHEDLSSQLWVNSGEVADNGIDDDSNGYVDDVHGVSIISGGEPQDGEGHGTHVAGTIAAASDGYGTNGLAPDARIMAVQALDRKGEGVSSDVDEGIRYAVNNGAQIINLSLGSDFITTDDRAAIDYAQSAGVLVVGVAGNETSNADGKPWFPTGLKNSNLITVASVNDNARLSYFSNYGKSSVDIAAFGVDVPSTYKNDQYAYSTGTSMASPMVAGAAALLAGLYPAGGADEWKQALMSSVVKLPALSGKVLSGGVPNMAAALAREEVLHGNQPPAMSTRFVAVTGASSRSGSRRSLKLAWGIAGGGAGQVQNVRVTARGKTVYSKNGHAVIGKLNTGWATATLKARNAAGVTLATKTIKTRLR